MIRAAYGFKPQTEGRAGRYWQEASGFAISAATGEWKGEGHAIAPYNV